MKKILLSVAILAVAASCSQNEVVETPHANAIGFSTLNNRVTKVANVNAKPAAGTAGTNSSYNVYAVSSTAATAWYINQALVSSADVAGGTYYWPTGDEKLSFYAFAPSETAGLMVVSETVGSKLDLTFTVPTTANTDFTIAAPVTGASCKKGTPNTVTPDDATVTAEGKVSLKFSHMLSKATIDVALSDALNDEYVMTIGDITFTAENNTVTANAVAGPVNGASSKVGTPAPAYPYSIVLGSTAATSFTGLQELMFAPHDASTACKIKIAGVTIKNKATGDYLVDSATTGKEIEYPITSLTTVAGTAYKFTVTVDADDFGLLTITFASSEDTAWGSGTGVAVAQ